MSRRPYSHRIMISLGRNAASGEFFPALVHRVAEGGYWAEVPAIPGCATQAESPPQLRKHLRGAISGCLNFKDHLAVLAARARNAGKCTCSSAVVRTRLALASKK